MIDLLFLLALSPILWLVVALSFLRVPAWKACPVALAIACIVAMNVSEWNMLLVHEFEAILEGVALAFWPILLVICAAIFTYNLTLHTKAMEVIKGMLTSVSQDRRVLILLISLGFGGFLEGMAGFGTAVAIPAGILAGIGIDPIMAAAVCLIANAIPTAFGSIGIPIITLANLTGGDPSLMATFTTIQLTAICIVCPFLMTIVAGNGIKGLKNMVMMCLASGLAFLIPQLLVCMFMGPELAAVTGALCAMATIVILAKTSDISDPEYQIQLHEHVEITPKKALIAWLPFILIFVFIMLTGKLVPPVAETLGAIKTSVLIYTGEGGTPYTFVWIATPGVMIMLSAFISGRVQGASFSEILTVLYHTVLGLRFTIITIVTVIATAKVMGYSGMTYQMAETAVELTGSYYPAVAAFVGSMGAFITGSGTSSCILFGELQAIAMRSLGAGELEQLWVASSNATGACAGKIVSPQSIAIAAAAIGVSGCEAQLLSFAVKIYIPFIIYMGAIVYFGQSIVTFFG